MNPVKIKTVKINNTIYYLKAFLKNEVVVQVDAFQCTGECYQERDVVYDPPRPTFIKIRTTNSLDTTYFLEDAQRVFEGDIKWDGCSSLNFFPDEGGNEHFCGKNSAVALGSLIGEAYQFAKELMGDEVFDEDLFNG